MKRRGSNCSLCYDCPHLESLTSGKTFNLQNTKTYNFNTNARQWKQKLLWGKIIQRTMFDSIFSDLFKNRQKFQVLFILSLLKIVKLHTNFQIWMQGKITKGIRNSRKRFNFKFWSFVSYNHLDTLHINLKFLIRFLQECISDYPDALIQMLNPCFKKSKNKSSVHSLVVFHTLIDVPHISVRNVYLFPLKN